MRLVAPWVLARTAVAVAAAAWIGGASGALAGDDGPHGWSLSLLDEVRLGLLAHNIEPANAEDGVDINVELLTRRLGQSYDNAFLDVALRPRLHLGASINTAGDTSQIYAGFTWDVKLAQKLSLELTFGGAAHDGPTGDNGPDSYGCTLNFRESASVGYALDERWTVYGTVAHMSNGNLCDRNSGLTSIGVRMGYKLR